VKTYATKPDRIINSMRNLAAFSAGTSLGQALPIRGASGTVLATTNASLQRQFSTALAGYHAASTNEYLRLHRALAGFPTAIPAAWAKANGIKSDGAEFASLTNSLSSAWSEEIGGALDASKKAWDQALNEKKDVATLGSFAEAEIPELLRKGLTAFARIQQGIQGTSQPKDGKAAASQELVRLVQPVLRRAVADRNAAFDQLQAALRVIKSGAE
jgi:hypothetical protein